MNPNQIKKARLTAGYTQAQIASLMGITIAAVSGWENGVSSMSNISKILFKIVTSSKPKKTLRKHIRASINRGKK